MPSFKHQGLIELFRHRPELAAELLRDVLGVDLPAYAEARVESADLTDMKPAERQADLVVLLASSKPVLGIVVEVQLKPDPDKRRRWAAYVVGLRDRLDCPACVLAVTPNEATARWCREAIELGPGNVFRPLVIGPASIPIVDDVAEAARDPELAVLSVMAHGAEAFAEAIGRTALMAIRQLPPDQQVLYCDLILAAVSDAARKTLEKLMITGDYEFQSAYFKRRIAEEGARVAAEEGARVRAEGREEGCIVGEARTLLLILEARGLLIHDKARARILACSDTAQLDAWVRKAISVAAVDELF